MYTAVVVRRALQQTGYKPMVEDWVSHAAWPFIAYTALLVEACVLGSHPTSTLFLIAATALGLLFIGIHNAWDTVTYITIGQYPPNDPGR